MNPLLAAIQAGALAFAEGLLRNAGITPATIGRMVEQFPGIAADTLTQVLDLAGRGMSAGISLEQLASGEVLPLADIPIMPGIRRYNIEADVAVDWRGPEGTLGSSRITIEMGREIDLESLLERAQSAVEEGIDSSPPIESGSAVLEMRVIGVYRG